ncbi:MAG: squalene/phytoene synthase family protein [Limnohabitans sp.]
MRTRPMHSQQILQGVSRSFALSIRLLPGALRGQVGLAYLLARLTDTVADTPRVAVGQRLALLGSLQHAISAPEAHPQLATALQDFARHVSDPHEQALLLRGQTCLDALGALAPGDQAVIRTVLAAITEGQCWDLQTLDTPGPGVQTEAEVARYTWQVAGSVGEFWTRICDLHLRHWHQGSTAEMLAWGAAYGQGLQRLNILRDAHRDLLAGRCYFPAESLAPWGLDRDRLCAAVRAGDLATLQGLAPLLQDWQRQTESLLHAGLRYSLALDGWRLRLASALPCLIGIRTLALLRQAGPQALLGHVKLPRREVRQLLWALVLSGVSDRQLQRSWDRGLAAPPLRPV